MTAAEFALQFIRVTKNYASDRVLQNINFSLRKGEMAFLTGHSGAGKSTILKLIMGFERCSQGEILFEGNPIHKLSQKKWPYLRRRISIILQDPHLLAKQNVFNNVALPLKIQGYKTAEIKTAVEMALDKVSLLAKAKLYPHQLSGGEQQRASIARALVSNPSLLLADEPTGNVDPNLAIDLMKVFEDLNQSGIALLIASHDLALITKLQHRILVLEKGHLIKKQRHYGNI